MEAAKLGLWVELTVDVAVKLGLMLGDIVLEKDAVLLGERDGEEDWQGETVEVWLGFSVMEAVILGLRVELTVN